MILISGKGARAMNEGKPLQRERGRVLTKQQEKLLDFFENDLQYGEAQVIIKNGQPVFVRVAYRDVKLD